MCRLSSGTGNLSEERMTSVFKDCCRLLSCLLVFSGLVSAWACLRVIGGPAGAVMGMTGSLSQRTPGDTHPLCALSLCTAFTEEWKRQVLQPVWSVWKQKTTADRDAVPCGSEVRVDTNMLIFLLYSRLCGNIGAVVTFRLQEQMEAAIWSSQWSSRIFFCSQVHGNQTGESHLIVLHNVFSWSYRQIWWFEYLKTLFFHFGGFSSRTCSTSPVNVNIYVLFLHKALWPLCAQAVLNDVVTFVVSVLQSWNSTCMLIIKDLAPCPSQFNDNNCWGGGVSWWNIAVHMEVCQPSLFSHPSRLCLLGITAKLPPLRWTKHALLNLRLNQWSTWGPTRNLMRMIWIQFESWLIWELRTPFLKQCATKPHTAQTSSLMCGRTGRDKDQTNPSCMATL